MTLTKYKQKRDFSKTSEPPNKLINKRGDAKIFVIHEHHATNLHYDLRLEMSGVLKSWAVPKSPPTTKGTKRLAIQVEDHPLSYKDFEGIIPEGNYGAGKVKIWDKGTYELVDKDSKKIEINIKGKKLKGKYVLVNAKLGKDKKNWLFFKL